MKAKKTAMSNLFFVMIAFPLSSCMHAGMTMMHGGGNHQSVSEPVLEKEIIVGILKATAVFPRLEIGKKTFFTLTLVDANTSQPISGAIVHLHWEYLGKPESHEMSDTGAMHQQRDSSHSQRIEGQQAVHAAQAIEEGKEAGLYSIPYASNREGAHAFEFHVTAIGDRKLEQGISIGATRIVAGDKHDYAHDMMGTGRTTTYVIIGAMAMVAMIVAMMLGRGPF